MIECTIGVIHTLDGILFFKNRDLAAKYLLDRVTTWISTPDAHALRGTDLQTGSGAGVSIGVNRQGVCVANTHVISTPDATYDLLCERLLHDVREPDDVRTLVAGYVAQHAVQGGRILVASRKWTFLIEVLGNEFEIEEIEGDYVITNSFSLLHHPVKRPAIREQSSETRLQVASREIGAISSIGALKSILRSHVPEKGELSICNHRRDGGGTESSHIIQVQGSGISWSSLTGFPCENDYHTTHLFQKKT
jgi:hypothetical protein